jgi:Zn-dependent protease with chaperone function
MRWPDSTRSVCVCLAGIVLVLLGAGLGWAQSTEDEVRMGRDYARRLESRYRLWKDPVDQERVSRIGGIVAAVSDRPEIPYTFKIIDVDVPNGLSLPGGFVYVTKGLLSFVHSDHELAAVLGHEIGHVAHRHPLKKLGQSNDAAFWAFLVAVLSGDPAIAVGAQLMSVDLLSGYGRAFEKEADLSSIAYLVKTPYTPVAVLTVMERLARDAQMRPRPVLGIVRDHPDPDERVAYIEADLRQRGIPLARRVAANYLPVTVRTVTDGGREVGELQLSGTVIVRLPDASRVQTIAKRLDQYLNTDPDPGEIAALQSAAGWEIVGGRTLLMTVTQADVVFSEIPVEVVARTIQIRLQQVIRQDLRMRQYTGG